MIEILHVTVFFLVFINIIATFLAARLALKYALSTGLLDIPNSRSSHDTPTARGGGIAIVFVTLSNVLYWCTRDPGSAPELTALFGGGLLVAATGFLDDRSGLPAHFRLLIHAISAAIVIFGIGTISVALIFDNAVVAAASAILATGLALVWAINLYNFMDGIDGIASVQGIAMSVIALVVLEPDVPTAIPAMFLALGAACAGFLILNWAPARIFMGDVGSGYLGLMYGGLLVWATTEFGISIWTAMIIPAVFVTDASVTLLRRIIRNDEWFSAHRIHAYQHAARRYQSHAKVSLAIAAINLVFVFPSAYFCERSDALAPWITLFVYCSLGVAVAAFRAGRPEFP